MGSRWQVEKKNDPYYKRAKSEEYRSRASFKLKQLDIVGVDLNRIKPFHEPNFYGIRGDFTKDIVQQKVMELTNGKAKVLMSDAAPSLTGVKDLDHLRSVDLVETVFKIAENILETEGNLVIKAFQGPEYKRLLDSIKYDFRKVKSTKPPSSRQRSKEMYIVGLGYRKGPKKKK